MLLFLIEKNSKSKNRFVDILIIFKIKEWKRINQKKIRKKRQK